MTFNIRLLDRLSYDEAEPLLEQYINDLLDQFVESKTGRSYLKTYSQGGFWIGSFVEMAYLYGEMTLPKMTKSDAKLVMESILPRKLVLQHPSEADDAIPELVAFWTFLKVAYQLRSAGAIAKYLQSISDKFATWMFEPNRGGIAKSFIMQGMEAGYDMNTQEGLTAFQAEYNQRLQTTPQERPTVPIMPMVNPPPEVQKMFESLGIELPEAGEPLDLERLMSQLLEAASQDDSTLAEPPEFPSSDDVASRPPEREDQSLRQMMLGHDGIAPLELQDEQIELLKQQTITATEPGTILQDFQVMLDFIGSKGVAVSGKRHHLAMKQLAQLNAQLHQTIAIDLKRPQQKSYPNIQGLYLLLRATGMVNIVAQDKQCRLVLNPAIYEQWRQFNPTEQYFTLLEAWLIRGRGEMLGEDRSGPFTEGDRTLKSWVNIAGKSSCTYANYSDQNKLKYWPGFHNFFLMDAFGLLKIIPDKPAKGKGWRCQTIDALPFGRALITLMRQVYYAQEMTWQSDQDVTMPFNELQSVLSPYFPDWHQILKLPATGFQEGRHVFKVYLTPKIWRRVAISGEASLLALSSLILAAFEFDNDHLHQFTYTDELNRTVEVVHPYADGDRFTDKVKIGSLPLHEGSVLQYVFDFGDWWEFDLQLEAIETDAKPSTKSAKKGRSRQLQGEILEQQGKAPAQYPDAEDW